MNAGDRAVILEAAEMASGDPNDLFEWLRVRLGTQSKSFQLGVLLAMAQATMLAKPDCTDDIRGVVDWVVDVVRAD